MTIQNIKLELNTSFRTVTNSNYNTYVNNLIRFYNRLAQIEIVSYKLDEIEKKYSSIEEHASEYIKTSERVQTYNTHEENAVLCWFILKKVINDSEVGTEDLVRNIVTSYFSDEYGLDVIYSSFSQYIVEPVYNFIISSLNDTNLILSILIKYKHKAEWFKKDFLYQLFESDTQRGEANLSYNLYEYLFDQGIEFHIEPKAESGRPDLIESQTGHDRLVADVKIFDIVKSKGKSYIISGFNQVYTYTKTYNNSLGYLVIFKTCETDLSLNFTNKENSTPYITHNGKTIFFIVIDIFQYETTASKRGRAEAIEIKEEEFINILEE